MKLLVTIFLLGCLLLYFVNIALLKTPFLNLEWGIHAGIRFVVGFFVIGISCFYAQAFSFKRALQLTLLIVAADYVYDYFFGEFKLNFEIVLHGIYMLLWGALMGYVAANRRRKPAA